MKTKKIICILTIVTMLLTILPGIPTAALVDSSVRFKRVTSADEITLDSKYLIVAYDEAEGVYYTLGDQTGNESSGMRAPVQLKDNGDGTLSTLDSYEVSVYPLALELSKQYVTSGNAYSFKTESGGYLNAFYYYRKTYAFSETKSKSLPIDGTNGVSNWELVFRDDGAVLFKTTKTINKVEQTSYIRFFHYQSGSMINPAFSGGLINDSDIDLPTDEEGNPTMTEEDLTEENIPVKTYLYKEAANCEHDEEKLTHMPAQPSTCSTHGNCEYYICSGCGGYLDKDKNEITLAATVLPLAEHTNTTFVNATEPTCSAHGNIAHTYCNDCGGYFEGNSTETKINYEATIVPAVNHSYENGVCRYCGNEPEQRYFSKTSSTFGDGYRYIFVAEYDGKFYAMGEKNEKGMSAAEVTEAVGGVLSASTETTVFTEEVSYGESVKGSDYTYYVPVYIKVGQNYVKNDSMALTLVPIKDSATYWRSEYENDTHDDYVNYLCDDVNGGFICLVTDGGEPYFSVCNTVDENHIKAYRYGELCSHPGGLKHIPMQEPTCVKDGNIEYWHCDECGNFSDALGLNRISNEDIPILASGAKDSDDDGICDLCGRTMPIFTKVTSPDEIVMGSQYILVSHMGDSRYVLKMPEKNSYGDYMDLGKEISAVGVTAEDDGTIKFNSANRKAALITKLDFACECSDLDQGNVRYALKTNVDNRVLNLESYGSFCLSDNAKYGWRIALNEDGSAKMSDVYEESIEDWNSGSGRLCLYRHMDKSANFRMFFSSSDKEDHTNENTATISKYPVYLYRLTEIGKIGGTLNTYTLNDVKSPVSQGVTLPSSSAAEISNISGMSQAIREDAVSGLIEKAGVTENAHINAVVGITAREYVEADKETGAGASLTYSINPQLIISTDSNPEGVKCDIPDDAFDGSPMKVMLYTGGLNPQQIVHISDDGTKEYFYPEWSKEVTNNGEKSFELSFDGINMFVTVSLTHFSDIKLLETPEKTYEFSVSDYDEKAGTVKVTCVDDGKYTLVFSDYEKGVLGSVKAKSAELLKGENTVSLPSGISLSSGDKILLWEDLLSIKPLCEGYTVK